MYKYSFLRIKYNHVNITSIIFYSMPEIDILN